MLSSKINNIIVQIDLISIDYNTKELDIDVNIDRGTKVDRNTKIDKEKCK